MPESRVRIGSGARAHVHGDRGRAAGCRARRCSSVHDRAGTRVDRVTRPVRAARGGCARARPPAGRLAVARGARPDADRPSDAPLPDRRSGRLRRPGATSADQLSTDRPRPVRRGRRWGGLDASGCLVLGRGSCGRLRRPGARVRGHDPPDADRPDRRRPFRRDRRLVRGRRRDDGGPRVPAALVEGGHRRAQLRLLLRHVGPGQPDPRRRPRRRSCWSWRWASSGRSSRSGSERACCPWRSGACSSVLSGRTRSARSGRTSASSSSRSAALALVIGGVVATWASRHVEVDPLV